MDGSGLLTNWGADGLSGRLAPTVEAASVERLRPARGTWFVPTLDLKGEAGRSLEDEALKLIAAVEKRKRRRRPEDRVNHRRTVRAVLANGLRCRFFRDPPSVAYLRGAGRSRALPGWPAWLSDDAVGTTVDLLAAANLVFAETGTHGLTASTYRVSDDLFSLAGLSGIRFESLQLTLSLGQLVRLRERNAETPQMERPHLLEVYRWTERLSTLNRFLAAQDLRLPLNAAEEAEWVRHWNRERRKGEPRLTRPELFQTDLYRQFNNGSIKQGGRMYGGWWINTPKSLRPNIQINGQPTDELDFSGCFLRMLYHERGLQCVDDPYTIPAIQALEAKLHLPNGHFRRGVKKITQALINDCGGKAPERVLIENGVSFRPHFTRREVRAMIETKHAAISDAFASGSGLRLQRFEGDLMLKIVLTLRDRGVVALPIHDGIRIPTDHKLLCREVMVALYKEQFGFEPVID
jgi:hypothetical protein